MKRRTRKKCSRLLGICMVIVLVLTSINFPLGGVVEVKAEVQIYKTKDLYDYALANYTKKLIAGYAKSTVYYGDTFGKIINAGDSITLNTYHSDYNAYLYFIDSTEVLTEEPAGDYSYFKQKMTKNYTHEVKETYTTDNDEVISAPKGWRYVGYHTRHFMDPNKDRRAFFFIPVHVCQSSSLTKTEAKAPTCTEDGNVEYYTCTNASCGKTYSDSEAKNEITDVKRAATGHSWNYIQDSNSKNTIKARCNNDGCTYKDSDDITLSINAKDAAYTGNAYSNVEVTDDLSSVTKASKGTVTYYATDSDGNKTGTSITAPVNKGNYVAELTITDASGTSYTVQDTFAIDKADQSATVSMADYSFDENVSIPTISGQKGTTEVTYYYNTTDSNENGTEWKDISVDTLEPGTYYMYAVIPETENYRAYTTPTTSFKVIGKEMTGIVANSVDTTYEKEEHSISVSGYPEGAMVAYGTEANHYNLTESPKFENAGGHRVYYKITARGYNPYYGDTTVTINPKEVELVWGNTNFIYNGDVQIPQATVKESSLCEGDSCNVTVTGGQTDSNQKAGSTTYMATADSLDNANYKLPDVKPTTEFTIAQKEIDINWTNTTLTYNRAEQKPTANLEGVCIGDTCDVIVDGGQTVVGDNYQATSTLLNDNYKIADEDRSVAYKIEPKLITEDMVGLDSVNHLYTYAGIPITPSVTVTDEGVVLESGEDKEYVLSGTTSADGYGEYELQVVGKGNYTGEVKVTWKIADSLPPMGTISTTQDSWTAFWHDVTFGRFFNETQNVTITAEDPAGEGGEATSGIDKIYYYKSPVILTYDAVAALPEGKWTEYTESFAVNPDDKLVIYAKITDKSGNVTYISTEGLVLDKTAPDITGVTDGQKYCGEKTIAVTDANLDKVTINGQEVTLAGATYQLSATEETGKEFSIVATDKAGNSTTVTVTICKGHIWPDDWTVLKAATQTEDGKEEMECSNGCGYKKIRVIPALGSGEDPYGTLEKDAEVAPDAPIREATLNTSKENLVSAMFGGSLGGSDARVWIEIDAVDESSISGAAKEKMIQEAEKNVGKNPTLTYLDVSLYKKVNDLQQKISTPGCNISISIVIPDALLNHDSLMVRDYKIIRLHGDEVATINGQFDESTKEFTFETDLFSTYAIAYTDTPKNTGNGSGGVTYRPVTGVTVTPEQATLTKAGETLQLAASVLPGYATNKTVTWTSDNEAVAIVDSTGKVTAVGNGIANITVTTQNSHKTAVSVITVKITPEATDAPSAPSESAQPVAPSETDAPSGSDTPTEPTPRPTKAPKPTAPKKATTDFGALKARTDKQTGTTVTLKWSKVSGADGYLIYGNKCNCHGAKYKLKLLKNIRGNRTFTWTQKQREQKTYYKYQIKAYKLVGGKKVIIAKSVGIHAVTKGGKYGVAKAVQIHKLAGKKVNKTAKNLKLTLKRGRTAVIKAVEIPAEKGKAIRHHRALCYESSNRKVAIVTKRGRIKAIRKGTCKIWVYAQNGVYKTITVTVK